ncbi:MAG: peptide-methionine (S)-S-oxide reductase MsrA [Bacteroidetes bacterium]|nr:peptide-methionine (S)-S-oxide reductase MsrA [Bacteroidota bacterium]
MKRLWTAIWAGMLGLTACHSQNDRTAHPAQPTPENTTMNLTELDTATFANGCFWCTEAIFQQVKGVYKVTSGYMGGQVASPTYKQVCSGNTGHAECLQVLYDPKVVSYDELLEVFWKTHDPTTLNRQGNDEGTQYRSAVFYHSPAQKALAEDYKQQLMEARIWEDPIVTEITEAGTFWPAEDYHQDYYNQNKAQSYCAYVITPKVEKFRKVFKDKLK